MKQTVLASQPLAAVPHGTPYGTRLGTEDGETASRRVTRTASSRCSRLRWDAGRRVVFSGGAA